MFVRRLYPVSLALLIALVQVGYPASSEGLARNLSSQLQRYGPSDPGSVERRDALMLLDDLLLNESYEAPRTISADFISTAISEMTSSSRTTSVWYIWNMGYVVRAKDKVLGFDLPEVLIDPLNEEQIRIIAQSLDFFFVSHMDKPHRDLDIVSLMGAESRVVCPQEVVESFDMVVDRQCEVVGMETGESLTIDGVQIRAFFGDDRRGTPMRCYHVNCGGVRVLQTGDQHYVADWMAELKGKVDVLMIGPLEEFEWVVEAIETIQPRYTIPGGIYDMSHPRDTWAGYPYCYDLREQSEHQVVPMFFGEKLQLAGSGGGDLPIPYIAAFIALVGIGGAGAVLLSRRGEGQRRRKPRRGGGENHECERRYVERLCLTCKHYALKGGRPYCRKYNLYLDTDDETT